MAIIFNPNKKIFTLQTAHTTYQMQVDKVEINKDPVDVSTIEW